MVFTMFTDDYDDDDDDDDDDDSVASGVKWRGLSSSSSQSYGLFLNY